MRTMESDLQSFRASGGGKPRPDRIALSHPEEKKSRLSWFTVKNIEVRWLFLAGAAALAFVGLLFYGISRFTPPPLPEGLSGVAISSSSSSSETDKEQSSDGSSSRAASLSRRGIFRRPLERSASFAIVGAIQNIDDLKTPAQRLQEALAAIPRVAATSSSLIQIIPTDTGGTPIPLSQFISLFDATVLDPQFFSTRFEDQFVMFGYQDARGWWPGYILNLRGSENWLFLQGDVRALESSSKIQNFYVSSPGDPKNKFYDIKIGEVSARAMDWTGVPTSFVYGWFRGYLILSTSRQGLEAVLPRL